MYLRRPRSNTNEIKMRSSRNYTEPDKQRTIKIVVNLNVTEDSFAPNNKYYDRVKSRLHETNLVFDAILSWSPNDEKVCPSSVAEYLNNAGYEVEVCSTKFNSVHKYDTRIPDLSNNKPIHILEWLGALALDCDMSKVDVDTQSDLEVPSTTLIWRGLYSSRQIEALFQALVAYIQQKPTTRWLSLNVHGFYNSASCYRDEHYTILIDTHLTCSVHTMASN